MRSINLPHVVAVLLTFTLLGPTTGAAVERSEWQFAFGDTGDGATARGVSSSSDYTPSQGFGLESRDKTQAWASPDGNVHGLRSDKPFLFSAAVPEGFYDVSVTLGHPEQPSQITVKAEARRLMLQGISLRAGEYVTRTFTVAVKRPLLKTGKRIGLKASQPDVN